MSAPAPLAIAVPQDCLPEGRLLHVMRFPIRWGDMDALGHVNNIMYFRYFEQMRITWYESLGRGSLTANEPGMVIVDNHAEYLRPLVYPADIVVCLAAQTPGRSSFVSTYTITVNDTLYTRGSSRVVWVDPEHGRSAPLPDFMRSALCGEPEADA